mgnify:CR=1 FL=1
MIAVLKKRFCMPYRSIADQVGLSYATLMRWKRRIADGQPAVCQLRQAVDVLIVPVEHPERVVVKARQAGNPSGFVIATGLLHAAGIALGLIHRWDTGRVVLRAAGSVVLAGGLYFLWGAVS